MTSTAIDRVPASAHVAQDVALFDFELAVGDDAPRARRSDPVTSQRAADKSQTSIHESRAAVLSLVRQEGVLTGSEANELYHLRYERNGWPKIAWDSPRKRLGDLERDGLVVIVNPHDPRGTEREYREAL